MASKAIGFLNFKFGADLGGFEKAMKKAQRKLKKFGKSVEKTGKNLTTGLTLPILALGAASIKAFDEQEKAIAQVEAGLKSTGNTVGITSEKLQQMAADLQKTTLFGDEEILKGATAQLLTFTNITGEQFEKTQKVALDLATRLDGDLKSASIMLGKALNDPIANLSALSRAGIQFSEEQKATVRSMVEMNDLAGAQTLILNELEKQYGGSAEAAAQAGMGPITQLTNQLSDLSEQIGARLIPYVKQFTTWIVGLAEKFDNLSESQKDNIVKYGLIIAAVGPVLIIIGKLSIGISALIPLFTAIGALIMNTLVPAFVRLFAVMLANPIIAVTTGLALLTAGIYAYVTSSDEAAKAAQRLKSEEEKLNSKLQEKKELLDSIALKEKKGVEHAVELKKQETAIQERLNNAKSKQEENLIKAQIKLERLKRKLDEIGNRSYSKIVDGLVIPLTQQEIQKKIDAASNSILKQSKLVSKLQDKFTKFSSKKITSEIEETTKSFEKYSDATDPLIKKMKEYSEISKKLWSDGGIQEGPENLLNWTEKLTDAQALANAGYRMFGDVLTSSLDSAINSQEKFFDVFIKNIKKAITGLLIQLAVLTLIKVLMGDGSAAFTLAGLKGSLGEIMNVKLAEGGLVTGPTTALIGEGVGTNAGNPEVVAPLDKLKSMMGGGNNSNITVTGKLIGSDIFLSNQNASNNRLRTT